MTKEREAEIRKHHAPHDFCCNDHCTTRGLLELLDAEREKNAKLIATMKQVETMLRANPFIMVNAANLLSQAAQGAKPHD